VNQTFQVPQEIVRVLSGLLSGPAQLHEPTFGGNEWGYVKECLDTGWVSTVGAYVDRFEEMLVEFTGAGHAIATVTGTAALHVCLMLAGVRPDDEVIVPALSFVATANAVSYLGAHPHFADAETATLGLDPAKLQDHLAETTEQTPDGLVNKATGRRIAAVICMHTFGHPVDLDALNEVCGRFGLTLIEDAAESLGSTYKGRHTGSTGRLAALSFNGNKIVTTGGGGAVLTNDPGLAQAAKHLTTTAKQPHAWEFIHDRVGFNYRMPNINAAMGCAQMEQLPGFLEAKRTLAGRYREAFKDVEGVTFIDEPDGARSNYWLNVLILDSELADLRDDILQAANDAGFMARPAWRPLHLLPMYEMAPKMDLSTAQDLARRLINIPSSPCLAGNTDA